MPLGNVANKFAAFGWHVIEIDGHNFQAIIDACELAKAVIEAPVAIIAHTIPGKGVDFMQYDYHWHGYFANIPGAPAQKDQARIALHELRTLAGRIRSEHE
jgi:transketolase